MRAKPRIQCSYPATIKILDGRANNYEAKARVINLSSSGVLLITKLAIRNNDEVQVKVAFATGALEYDNPSRLVAQATVIRNDLQSDGAVGIAVKFQEYKYI